MELVGDILWVLLVIVGIAVGLVLIMPVAVTARGEVSGERFAGTIGVEVRWALGLVGADLGLGRQTLRLFGLPVWHFGSGRSKSKRKPKRRAKPTPKRAKKRVRNNGPIWFWQKRDVLLAAGLRLLGTLHIKGRVEGVVGLDEPDDTIWLALAIHAVADRLPEGTLALDVDYSDLALELEGKLSAWAIPLHVAAVGLALVLFNSTVRHAIFGAPAREFPLTSPPAETQEG